MSRTFTTILGYKIRTHHTGGRARAHAKRINAPGTEIDAEFDPASGMFVPVVILREDQRWMARSLLEQGVLPRLPK